MIRIAYEREVEEHNLPKEVKEIVRNITETLDSEYGTDRHWKEDLGGIVLVLENEEYIWVPGTLMAETLVLRL